MGALNERWHRPTRSGSTGNCVEARHVDGVVELRSSKRPETGTVWFTRDEWETFIAAVHDDGEFRLP